MNKTETLEVERLWQAARFLPQSARLLGTRYRHLFLAYAKQFTAGGEARTVADALGFIEFAFRQNRVALLEPEQKALRQDARKLLRRYTLRRDGPALEAVEKWRIRQWLNI
ncbi:MAG: hypothetical protein HY921_12215 [Elusimicrobia bacterium]|nr:hypothetical protein [Elusimicrobiota bacterium]